MKIRKKGSTRFDFDFVCSSAAKNVWRKQKCNALWIASGGGHKLRQLARSSNYENASHLPFSPFVRNANIFVPTKILRKCQSHFEQTVDGTFSIFSWGKLMIFHGTVQFNFQFIHHYIRFPSSNYIERCEAIRRLSLTCCLFSMYPQLLNVISFSFIDDGINSNEPRSSFLCASMLGKAQTQTCTAHIRYTESTVCFGAVSNKNKTKQKKKKNGSRM